MQILVKVETGFNCNWRNIEPLQPEGFKGQTANEKETLKNSIVKNGFHDAFDVWQHDNKLLSIDGVHRKIALLELAAEGYEIPEQMPCTYVTAENETEAATIILSRNAQHSHIIRAAKLMEAYSIPAAIIEAVVPQKNLEAWSETEQDNAIQLTAEEDDFEFEDGGIETDIVIGDLFEIGVHRLLCGDSTDSDAVAKLMNGEKADISFTSPPYNAGTNVRGKFYENDNDDKTNDDYVKFLYDFTINTINNSTYSFVNLQILESNKHALIDYQYQLKDQLKDILIWNKKQYPPHINKGTFGCKWEYVFAFCYESKSRSFPASWQGKFPNVIETENASGNDFAQIHKATFPIAFPAWILEKMDFAQSVIDLFCGTGTTMIAAHQLNRKCYGMELSEKYCQVIIDRMRKLDPTLIIKRNGVIYE